MTNRNLGGYLIQGAGHADIVCDNGGQWWTVNLAFRQIDRWMQFHNLGREVFLEPVYWQEDGWFRVGCDGTSRIQFEVSETGCTYSDVPSPYPDEKWSIDPKTACYIRCPDSGNYKFEENGIIWLKGTGERLSSRGNVTFAGDRQHEFNCNARVCIKGNTVGEKTCCGLTAYMDEKNHYDLTVQRAEDGFKVQGIITVGGIALRSKEMTVKTEDILLQISATAYYYTLTAFDPDTETTLGFESDEKKWEETAQGRWEIMGGMESKYLSSEVCEGFTGVIIGIFCEDGGQDADFVKFTVK